MKEINDSDYELIHRYHNYELNDTERTAVLKRMETDSAFKYHIHNFGLFSAVLDETEDIEKDKTIDNWAKLVEPKRKPSFINNRRTIGYIIAIIGSLILAMMVWGVFKMDRTTAKTYAANEFKSNASQELSITSRGGGNDLITLEAAATAYNKGNYSEAIDSFKNISAISPMYERTSLWLGKAYMQTAAWNEAIDVFERIDDPTKYINYREETLWLLSLSYTLDDNPKEAQIHLKAIIDNPASLKKESAKLLLDKLE